MKKMMAMMMVLVLVGSMLCGSAMASGYTDYSAEGVYTLWVTKPAGHDHIYLYDRPSSTRGRNLGRIDDGDVVYVYYTIDTLKGSDSVWAYCDFMGIEGYIRFCNLMPGDYSWDGSGC